MPTPYKIDHEQAEEIVFRTWTEAPSEGEALLGYIARIRTRGPLSARNLYEAAIQCGITCDFRQSSAHPDGDYILVRQNERYMMDEVIGSLCEIAVNPDRVHKGFLDF